ncbi:MAG: ATP phosphoribosyltransferase regulatory subunit, partial [Bacteroidales bacterium]|nr:ATP phosphoribosyltransferase regulatory subunit [Bacteroidales bacterium]
SKGLTDEAINKLQPFFTIKGTNSEKLNIMRDLLQNSETGMKGVEELDTVFSYIDSFELKADIDFDITLARGLNYYTGAIFEVVSKDIKIGSVCGGGRYDDLTGIFGLKDVSGVGISFGADRIYDVLNQLDNFPESAESTTKLMFVNFGKDEEKHCLPLLAKVRNAGINAEIYPESAKMKKQMTYANKKGVAFVALIGQNEIEKGVINLKNMQTGEQKNVTVNELIKELG